MLRSTPGSSLPPSARGISPERAFGDLPDTRRRKPTRTRPPSTPAGSAGFTLIELMIVVVLIAVASSVASLALRDPASTTLEREGTRLAALLEGARSYARASGLATYWEPRTANPEVPGFRFVGLPPSDDLPSGWLEPGVSAEVVGARAIILGPEPLIPAQRIVLRLRDQRLLLATDGLGPFAVAAETDATSP